jgi:hypothetical protein
MDAGELESREGTRRAYVLRTIADIIEMAEIERRLEALEEKQARALAAPALPSGVAR